MERPKKRARGSSHASLKIANKDAGKSIGEGEKSTSTKQATTSAQSAKAASQERDRAVISQSSSLPANDLDDTYLVTSQSVISSAKINKKVKTCLEILSVFPAVPPAKPRVAMLHSTGSSCSKMISIVEIVKRNIAADGGKWFQYNKVEGKRITGIRSDKPSGVTADKDDGDHMDVDVESAELDGEGQSEDFETMPTPFERALDPKEKFRVVPIMVVYLSRVRIEKLRKAYG